MFLKPDDEQVGPLQEETAALQEELDRLRSENAEVSRLKEDNVRLQERNMHLAAELVVRTRDCSRLREALDRLQHDCRHQSGDLYHSDSSDLPHVLPGEASLAHSDTDTVGLMEDNVARIIHHTSRLNSRLAVTTRLPSFRLT